MSERERWEKKGHRERSWEKEEKTWHARVVHGVVEDVAEDEKVGQNHLRGKAAATRGHSRH